MIWKWKCWRLFKKKSKKNGRNMKYTDNGHSDDSDAVSPQVHQRKSVVTFETDQKSTMDVQRSVAGFQKHFKYLVENQHELIREYKGLRDWSSKRRRSNKSIGLHSDNFLKNRDAKTIPRNRHVVTLIRDSNPYAPGEYINASYIDGHYKSKEYITTQLPYNNTEDDFWTLIYQENLKHVMVLCEFARVGEDFTPFWLKNGPSAHFRTVRVRLFEEIKGEITTTYKIKIQDMQADGVVMDCTLVEYHFWRDSHFDNVRNILKVLKEFRQKRIQSSKRFAPSLVVCRNGEECSGVFLAMSVAIDQVEEDHVVDIPNIVRSIRKYRPHSVGSVAQYILCYDVMAKHLEQQGIRT